jgi:hypothetical protein
MFKATIIYQTTPSASFDMNDAIEKNKPMVEMHIWKSQK